VALHHTGFVVAALNMDFVGVGVVSGRLASACHNCHKILLRRPLDYHNRDNSCIDLLELTSSGAINLAPKTCFRLKDSGEGLSEVQYTWQDNITRGQVSIAYLIEEARLLVSVRKKDDLMRDNQAKIKTLPPGTVNHPMRKGAKQHIET
jgi:hypothetical protein